MELVSHLKKQGTFQTEVPQVRMLTYTFRETSRKSSKKNLEYTRLILTKDQVPTIRNVEIAILKWRKSESSKWNSKNS